MILQGRNLIIKADGVAIAAAKSWTFTYTAKRSRHRAHKREYGAQQLLVVSRGQ